MYVVVSISYGTKMTNVVNFLLFTEIARVRASLFQINGVRKEPLQLPEAEGEPVTLNEKVYVPVKEHPDVSRRTINFIASNDDFEEKSSRAMRINVNSFSNGSETISFSGREYLFS